MKIPRWSFSWKCNSYLLTIIFDHEISFIPRSIPLEKKNTNSPTSLFRQRLWSYSPKKTSGAMVVRVPTASVQFIWCSRCSRCQVCVLLFHSSNNCWKKSGIHSPVYPPLFTRFQKHRGGDVWKSTVVSKCVLKKDRSHSVNLGVQNVCIKKSR